MNSQQPTIGKVYPGTLILLLTVVLTVSACQDNNPTTVPETTPTGSIAVEVSPDSSFFVWHLSGPENLFHTGAGDSLFTDLPIGNYELAWNIIPGFYAPDPLCDTLTVAGGDTITFTGIFVPIPEPEPVYKILFIGSSYFGYNNLTNLFRNLAEAKGKEFLDNRVIVGGAYLDHHATSAATGAMINSEQWDYVVVQGAGRIMAYPDEAHFHVFDTIRRLRHIVELNCATTKMLFCLPWAFEDGMTWTTDGTDTYFDMQEHAYDTTLEYAERIDMQIAPVGWAFYQIMLTDPPTHYLYMRDWNHPSLKGSYLMACTIFASIYQETAVGANYYAGLEEAEAILFQQTASSIVLDDLELWHLLNEASAAVEN